MENPRTESLGNMNGPTQDMKSKGQNTEKRLERFSHEMGEKLGSAASDFSGTVTEYVKSGRDYVKENPAKGVALAAAAGALCGALITFAVRKRH